MNTHILIFLLSIALTHSATTKKKSTEESTPTPPPSDGTTPGPAILAIEIVDSSTNDTSTEARNNTKRTIESALGYGFQGNYYPTSQSKKYMIYPYSQRDIPPPSIKDANSKYLASQTLNIQKSVSYNLGTKVEPAQQKLFSPTQVYSEPSGDGGNYPSTLYSTVGQGGIIGGLSTHLPQHTSSASAAATTIPVIILRVYTNQLSDPSAIYPNLPQTHPYANNLNNVNLQSIISNYLQQQIYKQQAYQNPSVAYQGQGQEQGQNLIYQNPSYSLMYSTQGGYPSQESYTSQGSYPTQQPQIDYKSLEHASAALPTHENYPSDAHTRVVYHGPKGHIQGVSYSGGTSQTYGAPQQSQYTQSQSSYPQSQSAQSAYAPNSQYVYSTQGQDYAQNSQNAYTDSQEQSYATNSQQVYTDSQGQSYIYVDPNQLQQGQGYYQQDYQQQEYQPQQEYQQQQYQQQEYQQVYQKPQEDRKYLPVPQTNSEKVYNYHAESGKDRSKKSSGAPVTFESKKIETKRKA